MSVQDQVFEAPGTSGVPQEDVFGAYRMSAPHQRAERSPEPTSGYLDLQSSAQAKPVELAQTSEGSNNGKSDHEMMITEQQIGGLSTFLNSNTLKPRGDGILRPEDRQLNDRTAEWLRNRFEEELVAGGNPEAMQRRMNENLASLGLAVQYTPQAESIRPYRMSQLEVVDTRRTQQDIQGRPFNPVIGFAYDTGMPTRRRT